MHSCSSTALVVMMVAALAGPPAAYASDERHSQGVGSVAADLARFAPDLQGSPAPKDDPLSNGIAIGAAVGAATGLGLMGWAYAQCDDTCDAPEPAPMYLMAGGVSAGVGAVVGLLIDKAKKSTNQRVSIAGVVAPKRSQVRVTVRF